MAELLVDPKALASWLDARSPDVAAARARSAQALAAFDQSRVVPNPSLTASLGDVTIGRTNPPGLGLHQTVNANVTLGETIEIGKRGPRIEAARLSWDSAREAERDVLARRIADAREAMGRVVWLATRQEILDESLISARQAQDLERLRVEHGDLSENDFDRLVLDTLAIEAEVAQNRADLQAAQSTCAAILRAACAANGIPADVLDRAAPLGDPGDVEDRLAERPDVKALFLARDAARQSAILAGRRAIPDPTISLGYTHDRLTVAGNQPNALMLSLSFPLPIFDHGQHDRVAADRRADELDQSAVAIQEQGIANARGLLRRKEALEETLATLRETALPKSRRVLDATVQAFDSGQVSMTDLLLARRTHIALRLRETDLQFDAFATRSALRQVLGLDADLFWGTANHER